MDNETRLIELADAYSVAAGYSVEGLRANVVNPADRECEFVFSEADGSALGSTAEYRVFMGEFGHFIGCLLSDGSRPERAAGSLLKRDYEKSMEDSAAQYLEAHGVDTTNLEPRLVANVEFVKVWYRLDTDEDMFGGWHTVFMLESGELIGVQEDQ